MILGLDLVELRTVFFCNACVRYLPIKGDYDEVKSRHCMTLTHIKCVEEFRQREKRIAERQRKRIERELKEGKRTETVINEQEKEKASVTGTDEKLDASDVLVKSEQCNESESVETTDVSGTKDVDGEKIDDNLMDTSSNENVNSLIYISSLL